MQLTRSKIFYGWFVVAGGVVVTFGMSGAQFSFGVFMKPMTEDFGWSRAALSLAFGITFMLSGLLRPLAGYWADRYSPKAAFLSGVLVMGATLLLVPFIQNLAQLYVLFAIMAIGVTLGVGPILTKVVSSWFYSNRGVMLGLIAGAGSVGGMVLVPGSSLFLVLSDWQRAYWFLGLLLLIVALPVGVLLIKNRPEDVGLQPMGDLEGPVDENSTALGNQETLLGRDATLREAMRSPLFSKLTFGYFV